MKRERGREVWCDRARVTTNRRCNGAPAQRYILTDASPRSAIEFVRPKDMSYPVFGAPSKQQALRCVTSRLAFPAPWRLPPSSQIMLHLTLQAMQHSIRCRVWPQGRYRSALRHQ